MKGIILAGGTGSRLQPTTLGISKQLIPIYDKPMIYYPLSVLMLAGIRDILIISSPLYVDRFRDILGNGEFFGVRISYEVQDKPAGIAQAFLIGKEFIDKSSVALVLGDNFFFGPGFTDKLAKAIGNNRGATIFPYHVNNPHDFGVVEFDDDLNPISIQEKPECPKSNWAVTGLYIYNNDVVDIASSIRPSGRNELEISDINSIYLDRKELDVSLLGRGFAWMDAGTHDSLLETGLYVQTIEKRQGYKIACLEEIAFNQGWITEGDLKLAALRYKNSPYGDYVLSLSEFKY